jgi:hypothetical protein
MAKDTAIAAVSGTLIQMLKQHCPADLAQASKFELYNPARFEAPMQQGISLMLYRVAVDATARNFAVPRDAQGLAARPALPLTLRYLLTPWSPSVDKQQMLLGWAMRVMEDHALLSADLLNANIAGHQTFGPTEAVQILLDPLSMQDYALVCEPLKAQLPVSVTYVANGVHIDSPPLPTLPTGRAELLHRTS